MKKLMLVTLLLVLVPMITYAGPFLVCDVTTAAVEWYEIDGLEGSTVTSTAYPDGAGVRLNYDLDGTAVGTYNLNVRACDVWGCSTNSPFTFTRGPVLNPPSGVNIAP